MNASRVPLTVRLSPEAKAAFARAVTDAGMEPGTAARQILELFAARLATGTDYIDALALVKNALRPVVRVQAGKSP